MRILLVLALLILPTPPLTAQVEGPEQLRAVVSKYVEGRSRGVDQRVVLIETRQILHQVNELRFERRDGTWTDLEKSAMIEALVSRGIPTRPCVPDCGEASPNEVRLTLGRPQPAPDGGVNVLLEIYDKDQTSSGRRIFEFRVEKSGGRWSVTGTRFLLASDAVACEQAGLLEEARERSCGS